MKLSRFVASWAILVLSVGMTASALAIPRNSLIAEDELGGRYRMVDQGLSFDLIIEMTEDGALGGSLSSAGGRMTLEGYLEEGVGVGMIYDEQGAAYFEIHPGDGGVELYMIEPGSDGQPDYSRYRALQFTRSNVDESTRRAQPALERSDTVTSHSARSSLLGVWMTRGDEGDVYAVFESTNSMDYDGVRYSYTDDGSALHVAAEQGTLDFPYRLDGDRMTVVMEGQSVSFTRLPAEDPSRLEGRLCSYSGYVKSPTSYDNTSISSSNSNRYHFDGRGGFSTRSESSFSGSAGPGASDGFGGETATASGLSMDSDSGTYHLAGEKVILIFGDGTLLEMDVHHRTADGRINEVKCGKTLFAAGLCG